MKSGRRIAVLFHENSIERDFRAAVVFHLATFWREAGHSVVFLRGPARFVDADVLFVHVDLSVVPDRYLEFASRYPAAVNHRVKDIRKSQFSENLVSRDSAWTGPVIVKTDLNYGGIPELMLASNRILRATRAGRFLLRYHPRRRRMSPLSQGNNYPVYESIRAVPDAFWEDPRVVIERFIPEVDAGVYRLRLYQFLGDRATWRRISAPDAIVKSGNMINTEPIEPDPAVEAWRHRLGLDYGKIDYVIHDGQPIVLDANKTTGVDPRKTKVRDDRRRHHAGGIESFFTDSRPSARDAGTKRSDFS